MKAAIDLFTLGQAMVLAGGVEAGTGIIVKTLAVEMVSNAAGYSAGYAANEMGMPLPVTWILSVATGCTVSATVGGYLFTSADGTITKCTPEEAGDLIKKLNMDDRQPSFADMMSPEDAARYLRFLENGSTEGLTSAELEGIKKVDELLALKKISYQDVLDIRNSGKTLESGLDSGLTQSQIEDIVNTPKGSRLDPSSYLSQEYIDAHLAQFDDGASIIMTKEQYINYVKGNSTIGIPTDGTQFVLPKNYCDDIASKAAGDIGYYEKALGFDTGHFSDGGGLIRIDIENLDGLNLRIPSGNEAGANSHWIPGGKTDGGVPEANSDLILNVPTNVTVSEIK